ncbi:MAG: hypothetical protein E5X18_31780, partial [Mesorhizobium sp.]
MAMTFPASQSKSRRGCWTHAQPGQIIASRTMRDLVVGSGLTFDEQGEMKASGLPGALQYFAVTGAPP